MTTDSQEVINVLVVHVSYALTLWQLEQNGLTIGEKDNSHADPELLGKMMDINEEIHEDNPTPQRLKEIRDLNRGRQLGSMFTSSGYNRLCQPVLWPSVLRMYVCEQGIT